MNHPAASSGVSTKDKIDFIVASEGVLGPSFAMNHPAASSGVSTKDKIDFIVASEGVLGPSFAIKEFEYIVSAQPQKSKRSFSKTL